ncbi:hypothetical protein MTO96_032195 [Rhipicephalus appendiculatus]
MLITSLDIICTKPTGQVQPVKGVAERGGICTDKKVILVSDWDPDELYVSYSNAAHELIHSLGSPHDGVETSKNCSASEQHIMAPVSSLNRKTTLSNCTKKIVGEFLT